MSVSSVNHGTPAAASPRILLVTYRWSTLAEMPYLVQQAGCSVDVLCPADNFAIKNGFYDRWIDAGNSMDSLLAALAKFATDPSYHYIMIGDDPILWTIYRKRIAALWHLLPVKNVSALHILNKVGFAEHCHTNGIPSPDFRRVEDKATAKEAVDALGLPLIMKENYSNGGNGVRVLMDKPSFDAFVASADFSEPFLAQRFIEGRHVAVEALFKNGVLLQYVCSEVLEDNYGPSSKRRYFSNDDDIGCIISQLGTSGQLHGFANMALMQDGLTRQYYLFEADPRPNKWVPYARWFGRDFSPAFRIFLANGQDGVLLGPTHDIHKIDCWDIEHFSSQFTKLFNAGQYVDAILCLLNFDRNARYTAYDPVLLKSKMDLLHQKIVAQRDVGMTKPATAQTSTIVCPANSQKVTQQGKLMPTIKIDNVEYDLDSLSADAKAQLQSVQFVDQELARLQAQTAAMQTARNAYVQALKAALPVMSEAQSVA